MIGWWAMSCADCERRRQAMLQAFATAAAVIRNRTKQTWPIPLQKPRFRNDEPPRARAIWASKGKEPGGGIRGGVAAIGGRATLDSGAAGDSLDGRPGHRTSPGGWRRSA